METTTSAPSTALVPSGWQDVPALVCGFGNRVAGAPATTLLLRRQVHGDRVVDAATAPRALKDAPDAHPRLDVEADAIVVRTAGVIGGVRTADCVPILLVAPEHRWAAAVHAGWRGTIAGIARVAVDHAAGDGVPASALQAALGPSIGPCCYEVSQDLAERFSADGYPVLRPGSGGQPRLDLRSINARVLVRAGLAPGRIQFCGPCTRCAVSLYHSFRAEPGCEGRQVSWIGWRDRTRLPDR